MANLLSAKAVSKLNRLTNLVYQSSANVLLAQYQYLTRPNVSVFNICSPFVVFVIAEGYDVYDFPE